MYPDPESTTTTTESPDGRDTSSTESPDGRDTTTTESPNHHDGEDFENPNYVSRKKWIIFIINCIFIFRFILPIFYSLCSRHLSSDSSFWRHLFWIFLLLQKKSRKPRLHKVNLLFD